MRTTSGIEVDVVRGDNGSVPLGADTPKFRLLRVPHGPFAIRIRSAKSADVKVELDERHAFETRVRAGESKITSDDDDRPILFGTETSGLEDGQSAGGVHVTETGNVAISVRHATPKTRGVEQVPVENPWERIVFQMNTPGQAHNEAFAEHIDQVIVPEPEQGCGCGTYHADHQHRRHGGLVRKQ